MLGRLKVRMLKAVSLDSSKKSCSELNKSVKSVAILTSSHHYIVRTPQKIPWKGVEQKRGEGKQRFKKRGGGGQAGSRGGCHKRGAWNPLTNYALSKSHKWPGNTSTKFPLLYPASIELTPQGKLIIKNNESNFFTTALWCCV